jgi:pimeloyl-ACP methyl ester carboxylesterase
VIALRHAKASIALHPLREAAGPALLCLHQVGGSARDFAQAAALWPGPVFALDFCGHGSSDRLRSGAYFPEVLAGDADAALAHIGPARLLGVGIGAYVALLLAGGRPDLVSGALLVPGAGFEGGGAEPDFARDTLEFWTDCSPPLPGCDPAVRRLERDPRPPDYALEFAQAARRLLLATGDGLVPPPWWQAVRSSPTATLLPDGLEGGLARLAEL